MFKYSKHARQNGKDEITNQLREDRIEKEEKIAFWEKESAEYITLESKLFCLTLDIEKEMEEDLKIAQRYDDLFDERFEYSSNPWF